MGLLGVCYEELGLVRIRSRIGHGHHTAGIELGSEEIARGGEKGVCQIQCKWEEGKGVEGSRTTQQRGGNS